MTIVLANLLAATLALAEGADPAAIVAQGREHLATILKVRDAAVARLNERLAKDAATGDMFDLVLEAQEMRDHKPLVFELFVRGGRCYGGPAHLKSYNHGDHEIDASGLTCAGGRLSGTMRITLNPDQWVPADHRPRYQEHRLEATIADGKVSGSYRYTGELGPDKDALVGTVTPVPAAVTIADIGATEFTADAAGLVALAQAATTAYRQLRAAVVADLRYPLSFARAEEENRVPLPTWPTDGDATIITAEIDSYLAGLARIAKAFDPVAEMAVATGFCHPDDDRFGPFFANTELAMEASVAVLPAETSTAGPQRWQYIPAWDVIGPFPAPHRRDVVHPQLPELLPTPSMRFTLRTADLPDEHFIHPSWLQDGDRQNAYNPYGASNWFKTFVRPESAVLSRARCEVMSGRWEDSLIPPRWALGTTKVPIWGCTRASWFASVTLRAPRDLTVWAESRPLDAGQLWVNHRLVWQSAPDLEDIKRPKVAIFPVPLVAGDNTLVYRVRNDDSQTHFRLLFCTRGQPATAAELAVRATAGGADAAAAHTNFRGNGTGSFPAPPEGAPPPLAWDLTRKINVRWQVAMPSYTNSHPVVIGDRILTQSEPHTLHCLDKLTGAERWRVESNIAEFVPEAQRAAVAAACQRLGSIYQTAATADAELDRLMADREAVERTLAEEGEKLDAAAKDELTKRSADLERQIEGRRAAGGPGERILRELGAGFGGWFHFTGHSMPTPVTDGTRVWVKYATGVVACYDLEGRRQWMVDTGLVGPIPCVSSPVLIGDRLIVEGGTQKRARAAKRSKEDLMAAADAQIGEDLHFVVGLDANRGTEVWSAVVKCGSGGYGSPGGPRVMRLRLPESGHLDVVISQRNVFRATDGKELHRATGTAPGYTGYIIGDVLYSGGNLTRFWAESEEQIGVRHLLNGGGDGNSVLTGNGFLVGNPDPGINAGRTHIAMMDLVVTDAATGEQVHRINPLMSKTGPTYVPAAACGDYAYLTDGKCGGNPLSHSRAMVTVVRAGRPPEVVARSELDAETYTAPVFDGGRAYFRTRRSLICLEATPAGEALVAERGIAELFEVDSRLPPPPEQTMLRAIAPDPAAPPAGVPVNKVYERLGPPEWLVAGPIPPDAAPFAAVGGPAGVRVGEGGVAGELKFVPPAAQVVNAARGTNVDLFGRKQFSSSVSIDLSALSGGQGGAYHLYTVLEVTRPKALRYINKFANTQTWLAGQELKDEEDFTVVSGYYPLLIRIELARLPPFLANQKLAMSPLIKELSGIDEALAKWRDRVRPYRARLQHLVDTTTGRWVIPAQLYLKLLGDG